MSSKDYWYQVYLGKGAGASHAGFYHVHVARNDDGNRVLDCQFALQGRLNGSPVDHEARCRIVLERRGGRFLPIEVAYNEPSHASKLTFDHGRLNATGAAAGNDGASMPDDVIPTYAISVLGEEVFNQPEASVTFCGITEGTGAICAAEAKLVARGKTSDTPFHDGELWRVDWLSHEGTVLQSFYFTDEAVLAQADWGDTTARLVQHSSEAVPEGFRASKVLQDPHA